MPPFECLLDTKYQVATPPETGWEYIDTTGNVQVHSRLLHAAVLSTLQPDVQPCAASWMPLELMHFALCVVPAIPLEIMRFALCNDFLS